MDWFLVLVALRSKEDERLDTVFLAAKGYVFPRYYCQPSLLCNGNVLFSLLLAPHAADHASFISLINTGHLPWVRAAAASCCIAQGEDEHSSGPLPWPLGTSRRVPNGKAGPFQHCVKVEACWAFSAEENIKVEAAYIIYLEKLNILLLHLFFFFFFKE